MATHLIEVSLQRFILRTLLRELSLGLRAFVLDLILANVLLPGEHDRNEREHDWDYEQAHPVPDSLSTELSKRPRFSLPLMCFLLLQRVLLIPQVPGTIVDIYDES